MKTDCMRESLDIWVNDQQHPNAYIYLIRSFTLAILKWDESPLHNLLKFKGRLTEQASQNWLMARRLFGRKACRGCGTMPFYFFEGLPNGNNRPSLLLLSVLRFHQRFGWKRWFLEAVMSGVQVRSSCASRLLAHRKWRMKWNEFYPLLGSLCCQGESYGSTISPPPVSQCFFFGFRNGCWGLGIPEPKQKKITRIFYHLSY